MKKENNTTEKVNEQLFKDIKKDYPDQLERALQDDCVKCEHIYDAIP